jgi:ABC-type antimicrobial peptide transport system permease subunit
LVTESDIPQQTFQIVGVVKDAKYEDIHDPFGPQVFTPEAQFQDPSLDQQIVIRSDADVTSLIPEIKLAVAQTDPSLVLTFQVLKTTIREGLTRERMMATLSGFFGVLAAVLAMMGLYGVVSYMVIRRRTELGIRMALGATRSEILGLIMREAATLLLIGLITGTVLAILLGTTARSLLFNLSPTDPLTLAAAAGGLALTATLASLIPARRAANADPMRALREE